MTQTIDVIASDDNKKNEKISIDNLRKINLFIEITFLLHIQHYLLNISKK